MPDAHVDIWQELDAAVIGAIESRLLDLQGDQWDRLSHEEVQAQYPTRSYLCGWRLRVLFSDNLVRRLDILLTTGFPTFAPRTALVDHPPFLDWPHIERDGILCLLDNSAEVDPSAPVAVLENVVDRSCRLIEELLEGSIVERDFKDEFLTYWAYDINDGTHTYSLLSPNGPSRAVSVWHGKAFTVVAEDDVSLQAWLANRFPGAAHAFPLTKGLFVWHDTPMLPRQYPKEAADLLRQIERGGQAATDALLEIMPLFHQRLVCLFGAEGRYGPGLCTAALEQPRDKVRSRAKRDVLAKGYRPSSLPAALAIARFFDKGHVKRGKVQRADQAWVHGRGRDPRAAMLRDSSAVLFGCGSVGSEIAAMLLKAGLGTLHLVDPERLAWANVGRHYLGGDKVGLLKAGELADTLRRAYPHANITFQEKLVEAVVAEEPQWLSDATIIISATGSGHADSSLNSWHLRTGRTVPVIYGWTEPRAGAGHAVAIGRDGGCLRAGVDNLGRSLVEMTEWETASVQMEEPACGVHFAPYGAIELGYITTLIADLALEWVLADGTASVHRSWLARKALLDANGGAWTATALAALQGDANGGRTVDLAWPACECCCAGVAANAA